MAKRYPLTSRVLKLGISVVFFAGEALRRVISRMLGRIPDATCVILYYHSIAADQRSAFARQMDTVLSLATPIDEENAPAFVAGKHYSVITFDDGFEDAIENAVPELVRRKIHATFFVTVDALGKPAAWWPETDPERMRRLASPEKLRALPREWVRIAAHTMTHPRLSSLAEAEARYEIGEPRRRLQSLMGCEIKSLSFPYGDFNEDVVRWSREAGYERAYTTQPRNARFAVGQFLVGRVTADPSDWPLEFRLKLLGAYFWLPQAIALKRWLLGNSIARKQPGVSSSIAKDPVAQG